MSESKHLRTVLLAVTVERSTAGADGLPADSDIDGELVKHLDDQLFDVLHRDPVAGWVTDQWSITQLTQLHV